MQDNLLRHVPCASEIKHTCVLFLFTSYRNADHFSQIIVGRPIAQSISKRYFSFALEQADLQISICRYSQAITRATKVLTHWRNKSDLPCKSRDTICLLERDSILLVTRNANKSYIRYISVVSSTTHFRRIVVLVRKTFAGRDIPL